MLKIKNYIKAESLEQAYELNQKRTACVLGGMVWLKMGNRNIMTAIETLPLPRSVQHNRQHPGSPEGSR